MNTEHAIKLVKDTFQQELSLALRLRRVTAPLFVESGHGLNDDLTGVEKGSELRFPTGRNTMTERVVPRGAHTLCRCRYYVAAVI